MATKPKAPPNPLDAALDVRSGKVRFKDLPPETQRAVGRLNRFNEGKVVSHAARKQDERMTHAFLPGTRMRRAVLS